jgi:membrane fusion protein (multidrug efflux system)
LTKKVVSVFVRFVAPLHPKATYEIQDKKFVFVIDNKSIIHSQEKKKGEIPDLYVLESGLKAGDQILLRYPKSKENDKIKFIDAGKVISNLRLKAE